MRAKCRRGVKRVEVRGPSPAIMFAAFRRDTGRSRRMRETAQEGHDDPFEATWNELPFDIQVGKLAAPTRPYQI
jgi:hypothetical protein